MLPKVLIISGGPFDDLSGDSTTLNSIFKCYDPDRLAQIYFETATPNTTLCHRFFQISEFSMLKKIVVWNTKVGTSFISNSQAVLNTKSDEQRSQSIFKFVREHRSVLFYYLRDILWGLGLWKNKRLSNFIEEFKPDIVWCESYPIPFMHRLNLYVSKIADVNSVIFLQDDVYTYKPVSSALDYINRYFLRKIVKKDIENCKGHFVISSLMKQEYDKIFGIDSIVITKSVDTTKLPPIIKNVARPIRIVYMGNVGYGRIQTLRILAKAIDHINFAKIKYELNIYTSQYLSKSDQSLFMNSKGVNLCKPVKYSEVPDILQLHDIVLIVESLDKKYKNLAWLSFSTKMTDSLASGRCLLAIGPKDCASIDYLLKNKAAIVITDENNIEKVLLSLDEEMILKNVDNARKCAVDNHGERHIDTLVKNTLINIVEHKN